MYTGNVAHIFGCVPISVIVTTMRHAYMQSLSRPVHSTMLAVRVFWASQTSQKKVTSQIQFLMSYFWNNMIGWMLTNAGEVTHELNLSQLQCHHDAHDATPASCCMCSCYSNATRVYNKLSRVTSSPSWEFSLWAHVHAQSPDNGFKFSDITVSSGNTTHTALHVYALHEV